jgi:MFS transporter, SP family, general alpha glucoside:H+ symporter
LTGIIFLSIYATYYAQLAGYSDSMSFKLGITQQVLSCVGNMLSWYFIESIGRRNLTVYGSLVLGVMMWIMGGLAVGGTKSELQGTVAMLQLYGLVYSMTIGSTAYTYLTEVATARLRAKTIALGLALQSVFGLMWSFVLPYLFNPNEANLGGKVGFIFAALSIPCFVFLWWYQPETAKRSYEELDELFRLKIPARKFKTYKTRAQEEQKVVEQTESVREV